MNKFKLNTTCVLWSLDVRIAQDRFNSWCLLILRDGTMIVEDNTSSILNLCNILFSSQSGIELKGVNKGEHATKSITSLVVSYLADGKRRCDRNFGIFPTLRISL